MKTLAGFVFGILVPALMLSGVMANSALAQERIEFATGNYSGWTNYFADTTQERPKIDGKLMLPTGTGRVPAVVIMHGGAGITQSEELAAKRLVAEGFAVFLVDRATGRGLKVGLGANSRLRIGIPSNFADGMNALKALSGQPRIDPARIGILGFSLGGMIALGLNGQKFQGRFGPAGLHYAALVGVYPVCAIAEYGPNASTGAPTLLLVGGKDSTAPAVLCKEIVALQEKEGAKPAVTLVEYAESGHGWDDPELGSGGYAPQSTNLSKCPIVAMTSSGEFSLRKDGSVQSISVDDVGNIYKKCASYGSAYGYEPAVAKQSTEAWVKFLKTELRLGEGS